MKIRTLFHGPAVATTAMFALLNGTGMVVAQQQTPPKTETSAISQASSSASPAEEPANLALTSIEQGQTPLDEAFDWETRQWRIERRRSALHDTTFKFNLRSMYLGRNKYDGSESEAMAIGGWAGLKTGYFLDHIAFGVTGYTSQKLFGDADKDGTLLLAPGQESYSVLGELYADIRIIDGLNLYVGRKEFETPFINKNDVRMTPNTFEAITLQGTATFGENGGKLNYGLGYFSRIKERNSDEFVPMSVDAGSDVDRGVFTAGANYKRGNFSIGAIDYYSPDIINIAYTEAKLEIPVTPDWKPRLAAQFIDQRSVGDELLQDDGFSARQFGLRAELPCGNALFTAGFTTAGGDANLQSPWGGYPGYTSVQVEDFNRDGESAFILRAGYDFQSLKGLSTYALWVHGTKPDGEAQYGRDEYNMNLQYTAPEGVLKGLGVRLRYAIVDPRGGNDQTLTDFRVILNYGLNF